LGGAAGVPACEIAVAVELGDEVSGGGEADLVADPGEEVDAEWPVVFGEVTEAVGVGGGVDDVDFGAVLGAVEGGAGADVEHGGECAAVGELRERGVDAVGGRGVERGEVGGGEADGAAATVALGDGAFEGVWAAEDEGGIGGAAVGEEPADEGAGGFDDEVVVEVERLGLDDVDVEVEEGAEEGEGVDVTGAGLAEVEVVTFDEPGWGVGGDEGVDEVVGREGEEFGGWFEAEDFVGTAGEEEVAAVVEGGEEGVGFGGVDDGVWVRVEGECDDAAGGADVLAAAFDERAVTEVNAVEVPDGEGGGGHAGTVAGRGLGAGVRRGMGRRREI
jgi:hypothetical protein